MSKVAIIGAGPAGLAAARYLISEGFEPELFDAAPKLGGQWCGVAAYSGVWPSMRTNTSRDLTAFSDLPHAAGTPLYPTNQMMAAYLLAYAERFDLPRRLHLNTRVEQLARDPAGCGWVVRTAAGERVFSYAVVASGPFHRWSLPAVPGLASFAGEHGVAHTYQYKDPERLRGWRVLVAGGAVSALEIASDLAMLGAARVVVTQRRQRYVLPKLAAGVPSDQVVFTRFHALAEEALPAGDVNRMYTDLLLRLGGNPAYYGAPEPAPTLAEAGVALSQYFLPLVAEGRITLRPWMAAVDGCTVRFANGSAEEFDAILAGTGFELHLPFLDAGIRRTLDLDTHHMDLHRRTFHPDLPGLAFLGFWDQSGPYYPPIELQARWVAYCWSGAVAAPTREEMEAGVAAYRARRGMPQKTRMNAVAIDFARAAGVEPDLEQFPELARALLFGPLTPAGFRLSGRDRLPEAQERFARDAAAYRDAAVNQWTPERRQQLERVTEARRDDVFSRVVRMLCSR